MSRQTFQIENYRRNNQAAAREERAASQAACIALGIDTAILSKIERGERKATKEQIIKAADILELDKNELLVHYLSDRIAYELLDEETAKQTLRAASFHGLLTFMCNKL